MKFSSGLTDLMAFSEHHSRFHVVDARTFAYEQVVTASQERDISGLCFTPDGSKVYSCIGDNLVSLLPLYLSVSVSVSLSSSLLC